MSRTSSFSHRQQFSVLGIKKINLEEHVFTKAEYNSTLLTRIFSMP
jgi:hypothetical protein